MLTDDQWTPIILWSKKCLPEVRSRYLHLWNIFFCALLAIVILPHLHASDGTQTQHTCTLAILNIEKNSLYLPFGSSLAAVGSLFELEQ
jgi:hypothetical protein